MQIIFYPVWIDESAPTPTSQTMWIAAFFLCEQVGVATGQGALNVAILVFGEHGWRWSFLAETALLGGLTGILFLMIPGRYYTQGKDTEREDDSHLQNGQDQPRKVSFFNFTTSRTIPSMAEPMLAELKPQCFTVPSLIRSRPLAVVI
jgi:hypothetical protein